MKTACPVDSDVAFASVEACRTLHAATSRDTTEFEESIKHRAIVADVELALLFHEGVHIVWRYLLEKVNVLVGMKLGHFMLRRRFGSLKERISKSTSNSAYRPDYRS